MASEETSFRLAISAAPMGAIEVFERVRELGRSGSSDGCVSTSGMPSTELGVTSAGAGRVCAPAVALTSEGSSGAWGGSCGGGNCGGVWASGCGGFMAPVEVGRVVGVVICRKRRSCRARGSSMRALKAPARVQFRSGGYLAATFEFQIPCASLSPPARCSWWVWVHRRLFRSLRICPSAGVRRKVVIFR